MKLPNHVEDHAEFEGNLAHSAFGCSLKCANKAIEILIEFQVFGLDDLAKLRSFGGDGGIHFYECHSSVRVPNEKEGGQSSE